MATIKVDWKNFFYQKKDRRLKTRPFPKVRIESMQDYTKTLLKRWPDDVILHVNTNNIPTESVFDKNLA